MEIFTTVNREFVEKCLIALREVPAPLVEAIVHKKRVKITVDYDPKKQFIKTTFTEEAGQDRPEYSEQEGQASHHRANRREK